MKRFILVVLLAFGFISIVSCNKLSKDNTVKPVTYLSFESIDYNGGYTNEYVFDFENNVAKSRGYLPDEKENSEFRIIADFSEEEETTLINKLYSFGLFDIEDNYESPPGIFDGGGWRLNVEYSDGTTKKSVGSNNAPSSVFKDCSKAFYDICGEGVVATIPQEAYYLPNVSYSFRTSTINTAYSSYGERANYKWNGFESTDNNIYDINQTAEPLQSFHNGDRMTIFTANYGEYEKFDRLIVTTYDNNAALTNETTVFNDGWFDQIELSIQLNKIYLVRLEFKNGDFVEYTFNTNARTAVD